MMAASVNKSVSGVQTRFNKRSQPPVVKDVPQIVTRNSSSRIGFTVENVSSTTNIRKTTSNGKHWRSRRTAGATSDYSSLNSKEETSTTQTNDEKPCELFSSNSTSESTSSNAAGRSSPMNNATGDSSSMSNGGGGSSSMSNAAGHPSSMSNAAGQSSSLSNVADDSSMSNGSGSSSSTSNVTGSSSSMSNAGGSSSSTSNVTGSSSSMSNAGGSSSSTSNVTGSSSSTSNVTGSSSSMINGGGSSSSMSNGGGSSSSISNGGGGSSSISKGVGGSSTTSNVTGLSSMSNGGGSSSMSNGGDGSSSMSNGGFSSISNAASGSFSISNGTGSSSSMNNGGSCLPADESSSVDDGIRELKKEEKDVTDDSDSSKEKSKTGKHLKTLVHRLAPTPGFVDKNSLPSDLQSRRRVRRVASLNAAAKVNVFFEPSSPLAGRSLTDIMQHSKKFQGGGESDFHEQGAEQDTGAMKSKGRPSLMCISKSHSNYLQSPSLLSEVAHASLCSSRELNDENIPNGSRLKREQDDSVDNDLGGKRTKLDQNGRYATVIANRRFEKGKEVVDVGLQVEIPKFASVTASVVTNRATYCTCRPTKLIDIPVKSYVSTYSNGTLVSIPITKTHKLTPQIPEKPPQKLTEGDLACRSKRVAGLNSRAMLNAILTQDRRLPSTQNGGTKPRKTHIKKVFYEHGLNNTAPSILKIPKINFAATSTSNFSAFGRGKSFPGSQQGKVAIGAGSLWQKCPVVSHDGPKRTNGWFFLGPPMVKPYYYNDCMKTRKYYSGIKRNNEMIYARESVLLKSGPRRKDLPFVARVSGFWEEVEGPNAGEMMMSVLWYYRPEQTEMGKQPNIHGENEILASRHKDDNSVACIVDKCYVLSYPEYCRYRAAAKRSQDSRVPSVTPVPPAQLARTETPTPLKADPKLVFFCRKIYDYRMGRIMKNPFLYTAS